MVQVDDLIGFTAAEIPDGSKDPMVAVVRDHRRPADHLEVLGVRISSGPKRLTARRLARAAAAGAAVGRAGVSAARVAMLRVMVAAVGARAMIPPIRGGVIAVQV